MNIQSVRYRLRDPEQRQAAAIEFADWFRDLCLSFGCETETACFLGYKTAVQLERDAQRWAENELNEREAAKAARTDWSELT